MRRIALVAVAALAFPAAAFAHASLRSTTPHFGRELKTSPPQIVLHFDQRVTVLPGAIKVLDANGREFAGPTRVNGQDVSAPVRTLPRGGYTVRWQAISSDSHVVSGVWTFGVRVPAPAVGDAYGAGGPTTAEHVVRWLWFVGMAIAIGALGLRLICLRGLEVPLELQRRLAAVAGLGVIVAIQAGIAAFSLRSEDALQLPLSRFFYGDLSPIGATPFGHAFVAMTLGFAAVLALVYLSWLTDRLVFQVPAFLLAVGFAGGLSLSGHDAVDPGSSRLSELADWVHLAAASLWIGGLATLVFVVWFAAPELRRQAFLRFSRLATALIGLVLGAGTYLAFVRLPHLHDLWTQRYGVILLIKIGLVCLALGWGAFHHFVVRPRLAAADGGFLTRVGRSLAGESLVGVAVLLVAAILVDSRPPVQPAKSGPTVAAVRTP
ncbi:MAG TPA: copper resistance protein CopC [Gaiellaceae bacterium]|jgi:copper transport protein|nr:copper resistance protein CopC [Gaiellaceae bacterium]